ncbi:DUF4865 family protein [Streptomyces sp. NPDC092296]|uniref:DUF4865 family protein n=1 Tax=Streptomyces sp. NPDC092296 TaxID=3366012 RepID=UPI0037F9C33F
MDAMQYEITLPADYDMEIIRRRVADRGHLTDDFAGLGLKAYCVRERGVDGSPVNQYAPCYLWVSTEGMNRFLWGRGFGGLRDDFGRPPVQHWTGLGFRRGPAWGSLPRAATRNLTPVPADADPVAAVDLALAEAATRAGAAGVHSTAVAIDTRRWELMRFTLWQDAAPDDAQGTRYRVLHLSAPQLSELTVGRHW